MYQSITRSYYRGSIGAILVYDITSRDTFKSLSKWLVDTQAYSHKKTTVIIVGNKTDLYDKYHQSNIDEKFPEKRDRNLHRSMDSLSWSVLPNKALHKYIFPYSDFCQTMRTDIGQNRE